MKNEMTDTTLAELSDEETAEIVNGYLYPGEPSEEDEDCSEDDESDPEEEGYLPECYDPDADDHEFPDEE